MTTLLMPREVDRIFRYPRGRAARLARDGKIPHITLPDGELRFDQLQIERLLCPPVALAKAERREAVNA